MGRIKDHFFDEINNDDDGYDKYLEDLQILRHEAEYHILEVFNSLPLFKGDQPNYWSSGPLYDAIWKASTEILPNLEVQVVIDAENNCFVTTGSAGYVEFGMNVPTGMKTPVKVWFHTHPFGSAYFSGTDINTVSIWKNIAGFNNKPMMETAYVLGGEGHYGFWTVNSPNQLDIYESNSHTRTQTWSSEEE